MSAVTRDRTVKMTIAAVVSPVERAGLEAAGAGCFAVVHRTTLPEAIRVVRERPVDALIFSIHECCRQEIEQVYSMVRRFPDIPTVALVTRPDPAASELLLRLGASGIRHVVDVTNPTGWARLRHLLLAPVSRPAARIPFNRPDKSCKNAASTLRTGPLNSSTLSRASRTDVSIPSGNRSRASASAGNTGAI